jgi:hypothetical protein
MGGVNENQPYPLQAQPVVGAGEGQGGSGLTVRQSFLQIVLDTGSSTSQ